MPDARRRPLDNPRVLIAVAVLLLLALASLFWLSSRTSDIPPVYLSDFVLYTLLAVDLALLLTLLFVLVRNLAKVWYEQKQAAPFARFRAKLVAALLAMAIIPAVLVLVSGSEIITSSAARWFSEPVDQLLTAAQDIASRLYADHQEATAFRARRLARTLPAKDVTSGQMAAIEPIMKSELTTMQSGMIELYRAVTAPDGQLDVQFLAAEQSSTLPPDHVRALADRLALKALASGREEEAQDDLDSGGVLIRTASPILNADNTAVGAVVVSEHLDGAIKVEARQATNAHQNYQQLKVLKEPLQGSYLAIFLTVTLLILVSATWLGLYLAKRITRPVQKLAEGARAIGAGQLDFRLEPETGDELGALVEAFNMMAAELRTSQRKLEESRLDLEAKNLELDGRRRYIETILDRVATGVISLDSGGQILTVNGAAERLLGLGRGAIGQPATVVLSRPDLQPLLPLVRATWRRDRAGVVEEITLAREDREIHLAAASTALTGEDGAAEGAVLVLDDVTPLIRAQRVAAWRDVARRLAHEIKNPLTPIQLSAERLRRHFAGAGPQTWALVDECTEAIVTEVEALKGLVDEFAQFARLRGPRMLPVDLNQLVEDTLRLYAGVLQQGNLRVERELTPGLPLVRLDAEQIRQVIINLVDNAVEALGGASAPVRPGGERPTIRVATSYDDQGGMVRLVVTDNGPGVPPADREKLFMPYYSTKGRGSGLGLAIVRRIVAEHGGEIAVDDARPSGTIFTVELPAA
ncbi:MAG TPA: ATP-binding protein [Vicinamibacterales bacterium]|nr:ATP-binding protein [Vicinamibacterales bacterium]